MDLELTGRRAIVTGGSSGIGFAIAAALAAEGANVAIAARTRPKLEQAAELLGRYGTSVLAVPVDTTDDAAVRSLVSEVVATLGGVDILVNAAARPAKSIGLPVSAAELDDASFNEQIDTKLLGYYRCIRAVIPHMLRQGWGRVINISGLNARQTGSLLGSVRNVAVAAMTKNLADEFGHAGINFTVVHPGSTLTEGTRAHLAQEAEGRGVELDEALRTAGEKTSIGRLVTAEEVADVVVFLASPRSVALNGDPVCASGGAKGAIYY
jgi:NAD(P)-dependent dehydrogenase (short-subunit alcohol dehydrogenase family)